MQDLSSAPAQWGVNVRAFGAACDGRAVETRALQAALDACARAGGGTVVVPAGRYVTGALFLRATSRCTWTPAPRSSAARTLQTTR